MTPSGKATDGDLPRTIAWLRRRSQQALWEKSAAVVRRRGRLVMEDAALPGDPPRPPTGSDLLGEPPPAA
jgi:hypothetical protein